MDDVIDGPPAGEDAPQEAFTAHKRPLHERKKTRYDLLSLWWLNGDCLTVGYRNIDAVFLSGEGRQLILFCHTYAVRVTGRHLRELNKALALRACDSIREHDPQGPMPKEGAAVIERIEICAAAHPEPDMPCGIN
jgi:hypothetical protein